jgi:hypothetical protein
MLKTHEGGKASRISNKEELSKLVMSCMLWENTFYVDGVSIAKRIHDLAVSLDEQTVREIMLKAKFEQKLRHAPLWLAIAMAEKKWLKRNDVVAICTRADDMTELLALYWADGKKPVAKQLLHGLGDTFLKFNEYALAKYDRDGAVKLRDVLRLARPKPDTTERSSLWKRVIDRSLTTPDTWETALSAGKDKKETFERLINEDKLGDLAFVRNLRKMTEVEVSSDVIIDSFRKRKWSWILPFQFVTSARYNPKYEQYIEEAMLKCLAEMSRITEDVVLLVDTSGSMSDALSAKSETTRLDVGAGLAILLREVCERISIYKFDSDSSLVPARRGFALRDAIGKPYGCTEMWGAIRDTPSCKVKIVITDEETRDNGSYADANADLLVIINVASTSNGVGYGNKVLHINGWSENVVSFLQEYLKGVDR